MSKKINFKKLKLEEAVNRFKQLNEYDYFMPTVFEEDKSNELEDTDDSDIEYDEDDVQDELDVEEEQPGDEVVDIDDLTNSQEKTEIKVNGLYDKISDLKDILLKFTSITKENSHKIDALKKEVQMRNPTPKEKMELRSVIGYPFSEKPSEYWDKLKQRNPNYEIGNEKDEKKEYEIRRSDVENFNDFDVMRSLSEKKLTLSSVLDVE